MAPSPAAQPEPGRHSPAGEQPEEPAPGLQASSAPAWWLSSCSPSGSLALPMPGEGFSHASPTAGLQERGWAVRAKQHTGPQSPWLPTVFSMPPVTTGWVATQSTHRSCHSLRCGFRCPSPQEGRISVGHLPFEPAFSQCGWTRSEIQVLLRLPE